MPEGVELVSNSQIKMTATGAVYTVPSSTSGLAFLPAVMVDGAGNIIGSVDQGNGTYAVLATQIGGPVVILYQEQAVQRVASGYTDQLNSGPMVTGVQEMFLGINVTAIAGTSPSFTVSLQQKDANGIPQTLATTAAISQVGAVALSAGTATQNPMALNGGPYRLSWALGANTTSVTFQMSLQGR